ncbi:hypothetical protein [Cellulophaga sp. E6(2014)]|uniref:hypothetical protein n=1 Tax=Cellulophaga sp. E6(2014) TaxID=1495334 RepID=UPI00051DA37B|nr:hypothetical protein [Cellulophaga sp. E6(2014)]KGK32207.1 hypothetical protein EL45_02710 [Cellulophaga sp. E6(2014)]
MPTKNIFLLLFFAFFSLMNAQEMPVKYTFGEKYHDRYKYSNLLTIAPDGNGGSIMVRSYYTGIILKPRGYFIEHYNANLELVSEFNYKLKDANYVDAFVRNGQVYLLFLDYNHGKKTYDYVIHQSPYEKFDFKTQKILEIESDPVEQPLDRNYYNRNFGSGFTTTVLFDKAKSAFAISAHHKKGKDNKHNIYVFDTGLKELMHYDFSDEIEEKNYAFENLVISKDKQEVYLTAKAYFKKKRFAANERKFQYELLQVTNDGGKIQNFADPGKFPEALQPLLVADKVVCVGFYSNRRDNRYNGIAYFDINPATMEIATNKYHEFSEQFMLDKFGRDEDKDIKNLVFKGVEVTKENDILFNAEEYFVTSSIQRDPTGSSVKISRYHYNDIVSVKLAADGAMLWARNINKTEVTQGDPAYTSYCSYTKDGDTFFFISTASENPQLLSDERIMFKQGLGRNRNIFLIKLDAQGKMSYEKVIDNQEARLPLMVSMPLINKADENLIFYAKRGTKKQLVKVNF